MSAPQLATVLLLALVGAGALFVGLRAFVLTPGPHEALVLTGRAWSQPNGVRVGYRVVLSGRVVRTPFVEQATRLDLSPWEVELPMRQVRAPGRPPLEVTVVAQARVSSDPRFIANAIERFLGVSPGEAHQFVSHLLEGHLRAAFAAIPPDATDADLPALLRACQADLQADLRKVGFELDSLRVRSSEAPPAAPAGTPPGRGAVSP